MGKVLSRFSLQAYVALFFCFLLLPLLVTAGAAFNESRFPSVWPLKGFTLQWFVLVWNNTKLLGAVWNTILVALGVTLLSVPIGTAAAILLNNLSGKYRGMVYALMTAPILTPAAVVGISTLIFWRKLDVPAGVLMTTLGVSSIIAAFVMLLVLARLQSFDRTWEEAALDLGASNWQVLTAVVLPHLRPAIVVGAMISFLQALEAYNVPLFARGSVETLTIYIASQVRTGVTPEVNAVALIMMLVAVAVGIVYEVVRRREQRRKDTLQKLAREAERVEEEVKLAH